MICEIQLGRSVLLTRIDQLDFVTVNQYQWCAKPRSDGKGFYAFRYVRVSDSPRRYKRQLLHHFLMQPPPGYKVDHEDGDGLNNTRRNLRVCTQGQNTFNQKKRRGTVSGYKGVVKANLIHGKYQPGKPWRARIRHEGRLISLGHFLTQEEAALAYNAAAQEYFGEFAHLNVVAL